MEAQSQITTGRPDAGVLRHLPQGTESAPLQLTGGELAQLDTIYDICGRLVAGTATLGAGDIIVGKDFADTFGIKPGDQVTLVLPDGKPASLTVTGVFDFGSAAANSATAFVERRPGGHACSATRRTSTRPSTRRCSDVFSSKQVADALKAEPALNGLKVTEWQAENADLLSALQSQSSSSYMIQFFVLVAVALGIASTLAISAVQKTRQIGILKAMGMKDRQSGPHLPVAGADPRRERRRGRRRSAASRSSPCSRSWAATRPRCSRSRRRWASSSISFVVGVLVAVLSSLIPSRRTSKLDPIEVIQGG